jgi:hypothetical protein
VEAPQLFAALAVSQQPNARSSERVVRAGSVPFCLAIFLRLVVMPLDGIIHAYAEHYDFEREEDVRKPIYPRTIGHFEYFHFVAWNCLSARIALTRNAPSTAPLQGRQAWSF